MVLSRVSPESEATLIDIVGGKGHKIRTLQHGTRAGRKVQGLEPKWCWPCHDCRAGFQTGHWSRDGRE